jgi:hypothetical protein
MNKRDGSTLDSLFEELSELEEINAWAAKKILAIETERRMKKLGLSTTDLAQRIGTSPPLVARCSCMPRSVRLRIPALTQIANTIGPVYQCARWGSLPAGGNGARRERDTRMPSPYEGRQK